MNKSDLRNGMIVENRIGIKAMVMDDRLLFNHGWIDLKKVREDLTYQGEVEGDIVKVWDNFYSGFDYMISRTVAAVPIWERKRKPAVKLTRSELEAKLGYPVLIIPDEDEK